MGTSGTEFPRRAGTPPPQRGRAAPDMKPHLSSIPLPESASRWSRPATIFATVWTGVLLLFYLSPLRQGMFLELKTALLLGGSIAAFFFIEHLFLFRPSPAPTRRLPFMERRELAQLQNLKGKLFACWAIGVALTVVLQRGFPLLWRIIGDSRGYADFGIPTFNGGLVALYITVSLLSLNDYLKGGGGRALGRLALLCSYCVLTMNRGLLVYLLLNLGAYYLLHRTLNGGRLVRLVLMLGVFFYLLNFLAENRNEGNKYAIRQYMEEVSGGSFSDSIAGDLERGWKWLFLYATAPLVNLNYSINTVEPKYYPNYTIQPLLPTVVRERLFKYKEEEYENRYALQMTNAAFNTFTFYANYFRDFGLLGCVGVLLAVQIFACYFYRAAMRDDPGAQLVYSGIFAALVLTPFTDYFGTLIMIAQVTFGLTIGRALARGNEAAWRQVAGAR